MARKKIFQEDEYNDIHQMASALREYSKSYNSGEPLSEDNPYLKEEIAFRKQNYNKDMRVYKKKALKTGKINKKLVY